MGGCSQFKAIVAGSTTYVVLDGGKSCHQLPGDVRDETIMSK